MPARVSLYSRFRMIPGSKSPTIEAARVVLDDLGSLQQAHELSGLATQTIHGYFWGGTMNARDATMTQLMASHGYVRHDELHPRSGEVMVQWVRAKKIDREKELERQADFMLRKRRADERAEKRAARRKKNGKANGHSNGKRK